GFSSRVDQMILSHGAKATQHIKALRNLVYESGNAGVERHITRRLNFIQRCNLAAMVASQPPGKHGNKKSSGSTNLCDAMNGRKGPKGDLSGCSKVRGQSTRITPSWRRQAVSPNPPANYHKTAKLQRRSRRKRVAMPASGPHVSHS